MLRKLMKNKLKKLLSDNMLEVLKSFKPSVMFENCSYSQCGEDLIVKYILTAIYKDGIINYCDIGANAPWKFSNTAKFYYLNKKKYIGVLVEPDPLLAKILKLKRSKDIIVNKGIKSKNIDADKLDFFIMNIKTLNTFSEFEAKSYESLGYVIKLKTQIEVMDVNELLYKYFHDKDLHFLSIDVEGLDYDVLSSMDFDKYKPTCICIETIKFALRGMPEKDERIKEFLKEHGYFEYAFTGINSIFVLEELWSNRR